MHSKKVVVFRSHIPEERRVALTPEAAKKLTSLGWSVHMQSGAGARAGFMDAAYVDVKIHSDLATLGADANLVLCVTPPSQDQISVLPDYCAVIGLLAGEHAPSRMTKRPSYSLERLPRTSGAQVMDVLTSQSSLYGYWAVLDGARRLPYVLPMMTTPSGRLNPAHVLVLGAGVAGLQAMATAKRLGALVSAFDVRESARGAVESLDCQFYRVSEEPSHRAQTSTESQSSGGYAQRVGSDMLLAQQDMIASLLPKTHLVIATAMVPGHEPPILITSDMVKRMPFGSVIMDLATDRIGAPLGSSGNCEISRRGETQILQDVTIVGTSYGIGHMACSASPMYANNLVAFVHYAWDEDLGCINDQLDLVRPLRIGSEIAVRG